MYLILRPTPSQDNSIFYQEDIISGLLFSAGRFYKKKQQKPSVSDGPMDKCVCAIISGTGYWGTVVKKERRG